MGIRVKDCRCILHMYRKTYRKTVLIKVAGSVTRFGEILPLWQNKKNIWQFFKTFFIEFGKIKPTLTKVMLLGNFSLLQMAKCWINTRVIWSHWVAGRDENGSWGHSRCHISSEWKRKDFHQLSPLIERALHCSQSGRFRFGNRFASSSTQSESTGQPNHDSKCRFVLIFTRSTRCQP